MRGILGGALALMALAPRAVAQQEPAQPDSAHHGMMKEGMGCPMMQGMMGMMHGPDPNDTKR